jgi:hypothetical protein
MGTVTKILMAPAPVIAERVSAAFEGFGWRLDAGFTAKDIDECIHKIL